MLRTGPLKLSALCSWSYFASVMWCFWFCFNQYYFIFIPPLNWVRLYSKAGNLLTSFLIFKRYRTSLLIQVRTNLIISGAEEKRRLILRTVIPTRTKKLELQIIESSRRLVHLCMSTLIGRKWNTKDPRAGSLGCCSNVVCCACCWAALLAFLCVCVCMWAIEVDSLFSPWSSANAGAL